jgi:hypothetical protein
MIDTKNLMFFAALMGGMLSGLVRLMVDETIPIPARAKATGIWKDLVSYFKATTPFMSTATFALLSAIAAGLAGTIAPLNSIKIPSIARFVVVMPGIYVIVGAAVRASKQLPFINNLLYSPMDTDGKVVNKLGFDASVGAIVALMTALFVIGLKATKLTKTMAIM